MGSYSTPSDLRVCLGWVLQGFLIAPLPWSDARACRLVDNLGGQHNSTSRTLPGGDVEAPRPRSGFLTTPFHWLLAWSSPLGWCTRLVPRLASSSQASGVHGRSGGPEGAGHFSHRRTKPDLPVTQQVPGVRCRGASVHVGWWSTRP